MTSTVPFAARTTAAEVLDGVDLTGRRIIVTGGASGIGAETVRVLAHAGAEVTVAVRDPAKAAGLVAGLPSGAVRTAAPDLADLDSVAAFARTWDGPLDVLVANAGVMAIPDRRVTVAMVAMVSPIGGPVPAAGWQAMLRLCPGLVHRRVVACWTT